MWLAGKRNNGCVVVLVLSKVGWFSFAKGISEQEDILFHDPSTGKLRQVKPVTPDWRSLEDSSTPWSELENIAFNKKQFLIIGKAGSLSRAARCATLQFPVHCVSIQVTCAVT